MGNIRINYTFDTSTLPGSLKILEENHYYPFGLKHTESQTRKDILFEKKEEDEEWEKKVSAPPPPTFFVSEMVPNSGYQYKYNGKEWQDELGLNVTAMDFRMYDNALGRFNVIDAVADIMPGWSPYRFGFNNPVIWKDPKGLFESGGGDDDWDGGTIQLDEIVLRPKKSSSDKSVHDTGLPYNHSYWMMPKKYNAMSFDDYNTKHGTNYKTFDEWYYREKYLPFKLEMIADMHNAQQKAGIAVMALVGSVYGLSVLTMSPLATVPLAAPTTTTISANTGSTITTDLVLYSRTIIPRAPSGGVYIEGAFYKGGQFLPGARTTLSFGRQASFEFQSLHPLTSTLSPTPMNFQAYGEMARWGIGITGSGLGVYEAYKSHTNTMLKDNNSNNNTND